MDTSVGDGNEMETMTKEERKKKSTIGFDASLIRNFRIEGRDFNRVSSQNGRVDMAELWCNTT